MSAIAAPTAARPNVKGFFDPRTFSIQYDDVIAVVAPFAKTLSTASAEEDAKGDHREALCRAGCIAEGDQHLRRR